METDPAAWIRVLRNSHERLRAAVEPLGQDKLEQGAFPSEWTIAQVLSHLGSSAEITDLRLDAGLSGREPPGQEQCVPIWDRWNAKSPAAQAADGLRADQADVERFEALNADQLARFHLTMFGQDFDAAGLARMRLSEHALHSWDVLVALDPAATVAPDAVALLIDTLGMFVAWAGKPDGKQRKILVSTHVPECRFILETGQAVTLTAAGQSGPELGSSELRLPAEAFLRLIYGRMDPAHTPSSVQGTGVDLDDLRKVFPGI